MNKTADDDCKLTFGFSGDRLEVGHNVNAAGTYKRTSLCAAPAEP